MDAHEVETGTMSARTDQAGVCLDRRAAALAIRIHDVAWADSVMTDNRAPLNGEELMLGQPDEDGRVLLDEENAKLLWSLAFRACSVHMKYYKFTSEEHSRLGESFNGSLPHAYRVMRSYEKLMASDVRKYRATKRFALLLDDALARSITGNDERDEAATRP